MFCSAGRRYLRWFLLFSVSFAAGKDCSFPSPLLDLSEANSQLQGCTNVTSDLVIGDPACSGGSTVPFLLGEATTTSVQEIGGSLIIQCCNGLSLVRGWSALQTIRGSLIIEANMDLQSVVSAFAALNQLDGSLIIRQNGALVSVVTSFLALDRIGGYINIERNQKLSDLSGLGTLSVIEGKQLLGGSALSVLFNPALEDLAWLASMDSIENGVVHIEGNTALCYAGYPQWGTFGSFFNRSGVLGEDKGIDWRSLISSTAEWEYSWTGTSIPSLVVKGNAPSGSCVSATCHSNCPTGAGCFGPRLLSLCGSCQPLAAGGDTCQFNTSQVLSSGDACPVWPPAGSTLGLWVGLFVCAALLVMLVVVNVIVLVLCACCKKHPRKSKDTFHVGFTQYNPTSGAIALSPPSQDSSGTVLLNHRTTTDDFLPSVDGQQGGNIPWVMQKNMRHSLMESLPAVDAYAANHSESHFSPEQDPPHHLVMNGDALRASGTSAPPYTAIEGDKGFSPRTSDVSSITELEAGEDLTASAPRVDLSASVPSATSSSSISSSSPLLSTYDQLISDFHQEIPMHFPSDQIRVVKDVGTASFGRVYVADAKRLVKGLKKSTVVVKQLKEGATAVEKNTFLKPVAAMRTMKHRNVLALLGVCQEKNAIMLLLEHCSEGNLKTFLVRHQWEQHSFKQRGLVASMACDMARGVAYLHSISIAHNDLACRNCLVTGNHVVKIGDYGLSKEIFKEDYYSRQPGQTPLPIRWMAPELIHVQDDALLAHGSTLSGNVWSLGVTLWELCSFASWPYEDMLNEEVVEHVKNKPKCVLENPDEGGPLQDMYPLMQMCWRPAEERPLASEVLQLLMILRETFKGQRKKRSVSPLPAATVSLSQQQRVEPTVATIPTSMSCDHFTSPPASQCTKTAKAAGSHKGEGSSYEAKRSLKRRAYSSEQLNRSGQREEEEAKATTEQRKDLPRSNLKSSSSERNLTEKRVSFNLAMEDEDDPPQVVFSEDVAALIW